MIDQMTSKAQATEPSYELHTLGWKAFQTLCATIVGEVFGQTVQTFLDSSDGGRDGAFHGTWRNSDGEILTGSFVVQCKFVSKSDKNIQLSDIRDELEKAARLATRGLASNYLLFTNAGLGAETEAEMKAAFEAVPGICRFLDYGRSSITRMIRESPRLRMLVPRVYGLGDLSQILDERAHDQATEILSSLGDDLSKFVITNAYTRSARALVEHGFVLLLGEPACGKSTIAACLALGAVDEWRCSVFKTRDADGFVTHSNPHEQKQFFWVDDAFGATQLDTSATHAWNRTFPHVQSAIRRGARVVLTSRDYIYRAARSFLKESALPVIQASQVVVHVEELTKSEREQILYNHIRRGTQPTSFKSRVKPLLTSVAAHKRFTPEIARRLGNPTFTKRLVISLEGLEGFVARPMELLKEILRTLDADSRAAIALVFMHDGSLPSPIALSPENQELLGIMGSSGAAVRAAFLALEGSMLIQVMQGGAYAWRFKHPTIRDAFASLVAENLEFMDIYLRGAPVETLLHEVTCGDVGLEGVRVIVPTDRFPIVMARLRLLASEPPVNRDKVNDFRNYSPPERFAAPSERLTT